MQHDGSPSSRRTYDIGLPKSIRKEVLESRSTERDIAKDGSEKMLTKWKIEQIGIFQRMSHYTKSNATASVWRQDYYMLTDHFKELIWDGIKVQRIDNILDSELLLQREGLKNSHARVCRSMSKLTTSDGNQTTIPRATTSTRNHTTIPRATTSETNTFPIQTKINHFHFSFT